MTKEDLITLTERCLSLKEMRDRVEEEFKKAKSELETRLKEDCINSLTSDKASVKMSVQKRFAQYRDNGVVVKLIPENLRENVLVPDRKLINALISAGALPKEIQDEEVYTEVVTMTFKKVENGKEKR